MSNVIVCLVNHYVKLGNHMSTIVQWRQNHHSPSQQALIVFTQHSIKGQYLVLC